MLPIMWIPCCWCRDDLRNIPSLASEELKHLLHTSLVMSLMCALRNWQHWFRYWRLFGYMPSSQSMLTYHQTKLNGNIQVPLRFKHFHSRQYSRCYRQEAHFHLGGKTLRWCHMSVARSHKTYTCIVCSTATNKLNIKAPHNWPFAVVNHKTN